LFKALEMWKQFQESDAAYIMKQLLGALSYCQTRNVVHRDIKLENILVDALVESKRNVKIINFSNAINISNKKAGEIVGTPNYMAPETIEGEFSSKSDVWSLGVMAYVLLSGEYPFDGPTSDDVLYKIKDDECNFDGNFLSNFYTLNSKNMEENFRRSKRFNYKNA